MMRHLQIFRSRIPPTGVDEKFGVSQTRDEAKEKQQDSADCSSVQAGDNVSFGGRKWEKRVYCPMPLLTVNWNKGCWSFWNGRHVSSLGIQTNRRRHQVLHRCLLEDKDIDRI
eukprot:scaffold762_cov363-Pavlova_lutheri.AAC.74